MSRTLNQRMADAHEADIAEDIAGSLTKGSGNQWHNQGDAKNNERETPFPITADGKSTLGKSIAVSLTMWRKIVEQTFGQIPTLWLRFYKDESLREIEEDLVVIRRRDFNEILQAARRGTLKEDEERQFPLLEIEPSDGCSCCR